MNFSSMKNYKRIIASLGLATVMTVAVAAPAFAADTATATVTAGSLTATIADVNLGSVAYSHSNQSLSGTMVLTVDDARGSDIGWTYTTQSSAFARTGGGSIAATNFALSSAATPVATAGEAVSTTGGPRVPSVSPVGTLDTARKTIEAANTFGSGTYTQNLGVSLTVPGQSLAGTYTGTMTMTASAGPAT